LYFPRISAVSQRGYRCTTYPDFDGEITYYEVDIGARGRAGVAAAAGRRLEWRRGGSTGTAAYRFSAHHASTLLATARGDERRGFLANADVAAATPDALGPLDGGEAP